MWARRVTLATRFVWMCVVYLTNLQVDSNLGEWRVFEISKIIKIYSLICLIMLTSMFIEIKVI